MSNETVINNLKIFQQRLKVLRGNKRLQDVAADLGISRVTLGYYENGDRKPDIEILTRIANYYNVSSDYLLGLTDVAALDINDRIISEKTGLIEDSLQALYNIHSLDKRIAINMLLSAYPVLLALITEYLFTDFNYACEVNVPEENQAANSSVTHHMMEYNDLMPEKQIPISNLGFINKHLNEIYVNRNKDFYLNSYLLEIQKELVELRKVIQSNPDKEKMATLQKNLNSKPEDIDWEKLFNNINSLLG